MKKKFVVLIVIVLAILIVGILAFVSKRDAENKVKEKLIGKTFVGTIEHNSYEDFSFDLELRVTFTDAKTCDIYHYKMLYEQKIGNTQTGWVFADEHLNDIPYSVTAKQGLFYLEWEDSCSGADSPFTIEEWDGEIVLNTLDYDSGKNLIMVLAEDQ